MTKLLLLAVLAGSSAAQTARVYIFADAPELPLNPIWCDGVKVAQLRPDRFFGLNLAAGRHSFSGRQPGEKIILDLTAGETFYLRLERVFPYPGGRPAQPPDWYDTLTPAPAAFGRRVLGRLAPADPRDILDLDHVTIERPK